MPPLLPQYRQSNYRADAPETTEWQDIFHQKFEGTHAHAVYEQLVEAENAYYEAQVREQRLRENIKRDEGSDSSSFSDFLDDDDRRFFEQERARRKQQILHNQAQKIFGAVRRIIRSEYVGEVSENVNQVVYIDSEHLRECKLVAELLERVAHRFTHLKVLAIDYREASSDMPESACPTLVFYKSSEGERARKCGSLTGLTQIGGWQVTEDELCATLAHFGLIDAELDDGNRQQQYERILMRGVKGERHWD